MDIQETLKAILTCYNGGDFERAQGHASNLIHLQDSAEFRAIYGALVGMSGQRQAAEFYLLQAVQNFPTSGLLYGQLAEQKARQAKWDEAAQDFIKAFALAEGEWVFRHFQTVAVGFSEAVAAGALDGEIPTKMVNILDYQGSNFAKREKRFFALARRTIKAGVPLEGHSEFLDAFLEQELDKLWGIDEEISEDAMEATASSDSENIRYASIESEDVSELLEESEAASVRTAWDDLMEDLSGTAPVADNTALAMNEDTPPQTLREPTPSRRPPPRPKRPRHRRKAQDHKRRDSAVDGGGSSHSRVDTSTASGGGGSASWRVNRRRSTIGITTGNLLSEIAIFDAVDDALRLIRAHGIESLPLNSTGLLQLEWHAWFDRLSGDSATLALGGFLGQLAAGPLGATWHFEDEALDSHLFLAGEKMNPFAKARAWFEASDKDDVDLYDGMSADGHQNSLGIFPSLSTTQEHDQIAVQLARQWRSFGPTGSQPLDVIAKCIEVEELGLDWILFSADPRVLFPTVDPDSAAATWSPTKHFCRQTKTTLAYLPKERTFLSLASRKHFARFLDAQFDDLDEEASNRIGRWVFAYHLEGRAVGLSQLDPTLVMEEGTQILLLPCFVDGEEIAFKVTHTPGLTSAWQLSIVRNASD